MQPSTRITFSYPIYALDLLPDGTIAIAGGGGLMKSGIPNKCALLSFDQQSQTLSEQASIDLPDAVVALAASGTILYSIIGVGVKNLLCENHTLTPQSSFRHDLRVSATQDQSAIAISTDLSTLVIASDEGHVVSLSLPRYEKLFSAQLHTQGITDLVISPDGALVATTSRDRSAYIWASRTGHIEQILKPVISPDMRTHIRAIRFCQSNPDIIFTIESNPRKGGWIAAWQRPPRTHETVFKSIASFKVSADAITTCSVNNAGTLISASSSEGHVMLLRWSGSSFSLMWSTETKSDWFSPPRPPHNLPITGLRFSESGDYFFSASADYSVAAWPIKHPTDWSRMKRFLFWLLNMLILLFAILVAEDHALPNVVRDHRAQLQPHLDPQLSKLQGCVRPFIRDCQAHIEPYLTKIQVALQSHRKLAETHVQPYTDEPREHHPLMTSNQDESQDIVYQSDSTREPETQLDQEDALISAKTRNEKQDTKRSVNKALEEPGFNIDIHDRSEAKPHSLSQAASFPASQPGFDVSHQKTNSVENSAQFERTTMIQFGWEDHCTIGAEEEELLSPENQVWHFTANEIIDRHDDIYPELRDRVVVSKPERSIEGHDEAPESRWSEVQSSTVKRSKVTKAQKQENDSERGGLWVANEEPMNRNGPIRNGELSKDAGDLSAMGLESAKGDNAPKGRSIKPETEDTDTDTEYSFEEKCATSGTHKCPSTEEADKVSGLAGAVAGAASSLHSSKATTEPNETIGKNLSGDNPDMLELSETSSDLISEESNETPSDLLVFGENLLGQVHGGVDSILKESSQVLNKDSSESDSNR